MWWNKSDFKREKHKVQGKVYRMDGTEKIFNLKIISNFPCVRQNKVLV